MLIHKKKERDTMKRVNTELPNGYLESISKGIKAVRSFAGGMTEGSLSRKEALAALKQELETADAVVIGAGSGLSTAAGFTYGGERLYKYFGDFVAKYNIPDMYSGGFMVMQLKPEISWAFWSRYIYINRYLDPPKPVYENLRKLVEGRDYFVITTNVDHCFQKAGFDKKRLFYTQGDYGLFQSVNPTIRQTFDNEEWVLKAIEAQGFEKKEDGSWNIPAGKKLRMEIPTELIPKCPIDGSEMTMNLRADESFLEDEGWHRASAAYADFLRRHEDLHVLYLEIGVGMNTPVIIKYPFWQETCDNPKAVYACLNFNEAYCPEQIRKQSICIDGDSAEVIEQLLSMATRWWRV